VRENGLFEPFMSKNGIMLPRQARDKHGSKLKTRYDCFIRLIDSRMSSEGRGGGGAKKRISFLSAFPYVCPEPVLAK
jgi:hypothetical protein